MKKITIITLFVLIAIFVLTFVAVFTPTGSNAIIKPIVNKKIKQEVKDVKVDVVKLDNKYKYIDVDAIVENSIKTNAKGEVDYFNKKFNIDYRVDAKEVKVKNEKYNLNLGIKGKAVGDINNFNVSGFGNAFGSKLEYKVLVKDSKPKSIKAVINSARLSEIFLLAKLAPVVDGLAFINIAMPSLNINNPKGVAHIQIKNGKIDKELLFKHYKIKLPKDENLVANIEAKVENKKVVGSGVVYSDTIKLKIKKVISTLDFKVVKGYIEAKIDDLSRLNYITSQKLKGSLVVDGVVYSNIYKNIVQASLQSKSFGGLIKLFYNNNSLKVNLNKVSIKKLEKTISFPLYVTNGVVSGVVKISNLNKLNGAFNLKSAGSLNKKLFKIKVPSYKYSITTSGVLKNAKIYLKKSKLTTSYLKLLLSDTKYTILTDALISKFTLIVDNLARLKSLTKIALRGSLKLNGTVSKMGDIVDVNAVTKSLQGVTKIAYNKKALKVKFKNISVPKLLYMLNQPKLLSKGFATGSVNLKLSKKINGVISIATNGIVNRKTIQKLYKINLGKYFKYSIKRSDIIIKKSVASTKNLQIRSNLFTLDLNRALYKINSSNFKTKYKLKIDNLSKLKPLTKQDLKGSLTISGSIEKDGRDSLITGVGSKFGGNINFRVKNSVVTFNAAGISIVEVLDMLNKPKVLDGVTMLKLKYDTQREYGNFNSVVSQAKFLNSKLVYSLKQYANFDLTKEVFNEVLIDGTINKNIIKFNLKTKSNSKKIQILIKGGIIDTKMQIIKAKVTVKYKGKDYNFKVRGPLKDPSFKLSFSGAVKEKVLQKVKEKLLDKTGIGKDIDKLIPKELKGINSKDSNTQNNLEDKAKQKAKELFKGIF